METIELKIVSIVFYVLSLHANYGTDKIKYHKKN
jgi:hypothetical protein